MPNDELDFMDVLEILDPELHEALHLSINFSRPEAADAPGVRMGWGAGVLFGMHFACQYPKIAAQVERRIFATHPELPGPQKAADVVAEGFADKIFYLAEPLPEHLFAARLADLATVDEGEPAVTDWFPFPPPPHPYGGYEGLSV